MAQENLCDVQQPGAASSWELESDGSADETLALPAAPTDEPFLPPPSSSAVFPAAAAAVDSGDAAGGPPPVAVVPAAAAVVPAADAPAVGIGGVPWNSWDVPMGGRIVYDQRARSLGAHCPAHGSLCRINQVLKKRPLGYLGAWLNLAYACGDKDEHMQRRFDDSPTGARNSNNQEDARTAIVAAGNLGALIAMEPPP